MGLLTEFYYAPQDKGMDAYRDAIVAGLGEGEGSKSDAVKHIVWQAYMTKALTDRGIPRQLAAMIVNAGGVGKELLDVVGSKLNPETVRNSPMDLRNNAFGAKWLPLEGDISQNAIDAVRSGNTPSMFDAITQHRPYSYK